ncbi:MAG TPA: glycosyltransferase family 4 protein [Saprospiraceae bacterium]|nr:glycosyltransferase family 4 protein [Saprospiraceae bacterium]
MQNRKKVLIITYYWPPAGGAGVHRWLKFTKYLREFGWEPVIFTVQGGETAVEDQQLLQQIPKGIETIRQPIWEPYALFKRLKGQKKEEKVYSGFINEQGKSSWKQQLAVFIRGNFFIPDARMFWIRPSVRKLKQYLVEQPVDLIISTGPPHSTHRIAYHLRKKTRQPWIADFRDPWTNIDFYDQLRLTPLADRLHQRMEQQVLHRADQVVVISPSMQTEFVALAPNANITTITNGYDPADFQERPEVLDPEFSICHIGSMNKDRNPVLLWQALQNLLSEDPQLKEKLKIRLIGKIDHSILQSIDSFGLNSYLEKINQLPHQEVLQEMQRSQVLLLAINNTPNAAGILPGKMYEYMGAQRPILAIGPPQKDAGKILRKTGAGIMHDYQDLAGIQASLKEMFQAYLSEELSVDSKGTEQYSRRHLAGKYAQLMDQLIH